MHGWLPLTVQALAGLLLVLAIGWRTTGWRLVLLPCAAGVGVALAALTHWNIASNGLSGEPAPRQLWVWVALTGLAVGVAVLGWQSAVRWRRIVSVLAVPMTALSAGLMLNLWVG